MDGIATGSLYGALALAAGADLPDHRVVNFAQGEMAMFTTFLAWGLVSAGLPIGPGSWPRWRWRS